MMISSATPAREASALGKLCSSLSVIRQTEMRFIAGRRRAWTEIKYLTVERLVGWRRVSVWSGQRRAGQAPPLQGESGGRPARRRALTGGRPRRTKRIRMATGMAAAIFG